MSDAVAQVTPAARERRIPEWTFADKLRKVRTDMGLHQRDFAEQLDVGAPAYAAWESGRTRPQNIVSLAKRVELLSGVPAWWLLGLDATNPHQDGPGGGQKLPRLDSNQQPFGYTDPQVSRLDNLVVGPWSTNDNPAANPRHDEEHAA